MRKLLYKLIVCYAAAAVGMFVLLNTLGINSLQNHVIESRTEVMHNEALLIAEQYVKVYYDSTMTRRQMLEQLKAVDTYLDTRVWILNNDGNIIADTRQQLLPFGAAGNVSDFDPEFLEKETLIDVYYEEYFDKPMMIVTEPVFQDYSIRAYVSLISSMDTVEKSAVGYMDFINICFLIFLIFLGLIFAFLYLVTVRPIEKIKEAALRYAGGHFEHPLNIRSHDEFRELSDTINFMVSELKNVDDYQKKFIANISHDFRSPLTSIKGYAEAIMDGTIPYEAQNRYLSIILFETERLTNLTSNLLDLNRIDSTGMHLEISEFDVIEMIKRTIQTFEGACTKKRIQIKLEYAEDETYVTADATRVQQIIYNLLDNAVKFSNSDSDIVIGVREKGAKAMISVKDNGVGIPKENVKKVFDRFYKSDSSRGKDKKGTGLGLAIVKEIIVAHGENINVVSTEGVGTEFTFTLPLADD